MMVTDLAMRDMSDRGDATIERLCRWLAAPFRHRAETGTVQSGVYATSAGEPPTAAFAERAMEPIDFIRHRSQATCRRAFQLAAQHRFDEARSAFHTAIATDPLVDPADLPGFWELPRRGMFAAIEAYEDLGRYRDAAALEVRILQTSRATPDRLSSRSAVR